jgi:hypothetical protein
MTAGARAPTPEDIEAFYQANRDNFRGTAVLRAAHIVKHIDGQQIEEQALVGIEAALAELESGAAFAEVADRHPDIEAAFRSARFNIIVVALLRGKSAI